MRGDGGACAELLVEGQKVGVAAKRSGVERERLVCFSFAHQKKMLKNNDEFYIHCGVENLRTPSIYTSGVRR